MDAVTLDKSIARGPVVAVKLSQVLASFALINDQGRAVSQLTVFLEDQLSAGALAEITALAKAAAKNQVESAEKPLPAPPEPKPLP